MGLVYSEEDAVQRRSDGVENTLETGGATVAYARESEDGTVCLRRIGVLMYNYVTGGQMSQTGSERQFTKMICADNQGILRGHHGNEVSTIDKTCRKPHCA
jgi:hypothetical protein